MNAALPRGLSVFVVEDEALVAMNLEQMLLDLGCRVVGPAMRLDTADAMADDGLDADIAILDVNLRGVPVYPLAERLAARGMPLLFATGYGAHGLPAQWQDRPVVQKPYTEREVRAGLITALAPRSQYKAGG